MGQSLRSRLVVLVGLCICTLFLLSALAICLIFESFLWAEFDTSLRDQSRSVSHLVEQEADGYSFEWLEGEGLTSPIADDREVLSIWKEDKLMEVVPSNAKPMKPSPRIREDAFPVVLDDGTAARALEYRFQPRRVDEGGASDRGKKPEVSGMESAPLTMILARSTVGTWKTITTLRWTLAIVGGTGALGVSILLWRIVGYGLAPIQSATNRISRIQPGSLSERLPDVESQPVELKPLLSTINQLLGRLEEAFARERSFSSNVAHELRTPLAGLRAQLELALARPRNSSEYEDTMRHCLVITQQTSAIVESLFETIRSTSKAPSVEPVLIEEFLNVLLASARPKLDRRQLQMNIQLNSGCTIRTDRQMLGIVLRNLIDNSVSYADEGTTIDIAMQQTEEGCRFSISNQARSFPARDIDKVFDRFWRADPSRQATGIHSGLGLPLCQQLAHRLGAQIRATYHSGRFRIDLIFPSTATG